MAKLCLILCRFRYESLLTACYGGHQFSNFLWKVYLYIPQENISFSLLGSISQRYRRVPPPIRIWGPSIRQEERGEPLHSSSSRQPFLMTQWPAAFMSLIVTYYRVVSHWWGTQIKQLWLLFNPVETKVIKYPDRCIKWRHSRICHLLWSLILPKKWDFKTKDCCTKYAASKQKKRL